MSLSKREIQQAVMNRLDAMAGSCNSIYIAHNDGVLRGLIWALTGEDPGTRLSEDVLKVYALFDIPAVAMGDHIHYLKEGEATVNLTTPCEVCEEEREEKRRERVHADYVRVGVKARAEEALKRAFDLASCNRKVRALIERARSYTLPEDAAEAAGWTEVAIREAERVGLWFCSGEKPTDLALALQTAHAAVHELSEGKKNVWKQASDAREQVLALEYGHLLVRHDMIYVAMNLNLLRDALEARDAEAALRHTGEAVQLCEPLGKEAVLTELRRALLRLKETVVRLQ